MYETYRAAASLRLRGEDARATVAFRRVLADEPQMLDAWEDLGGALLRLGNEKEGIAALDRALAGDPDRATTHLALARAHAFAGRGAKATLHATAASKRDPGQAFELLAQLALADGHFPEAAEYARRSLAADPQRAVAHFVRGVVAQGQGRYEEALTALRAAEAAKARQKRLVVPGLYARTGDCLARLGRQAEAEAAFRAEIAEIPHTREGRVGLALLLRSQGRDQEARGVIEGVVSAHPSPGPEEYWTVVRTLAGLGDKAAALDWAAAARKRYPSDTRFRMQRLLTRGLEDGEQLARAGVAGDAGQQPFEQRHGVGAAAGARLDGREEEERVGLGPARGGVRGGRLPRLRLPAERSQRQPARHLGPRPLGRRRARRLRLLQCRERLRVLAVIVGERHPRGGVLWVERARALESGSRSGRIAPFQQQPSARELQLGAAGR